MKKMLKRFGHTNIALLIVCSIIVLVYTDIENPSTIDYVLLTTYGAIILVHFIRLLLIVLKKER